MLKAAILFGDNELLEHFKIVLPASFSLLFLTLSPLSFYLLYLSFSSVLLCDFPPLSLNLSPFVHSIQAYRSALEYLRKDGWYVEVEMNKAIMVCIVTHTDS